MDIQTLPPWAKAALASFNTVHHGLFQALGGAMPQVAAVVVSCFIMASLLVLPFFLPLLAWASSSSASSSDITSADARPADPKPAEKIRAPPLHADDGTESAPSEAKPVAEWSVEQVCAWLREVELGQLSDNFAQHDIAGALLFQLTAGEIATDLGVDKLADRKRLAAEIAALRRRDRWWVRWWEAAKRWWLRRRARRPAAQRAAEASKKRV